MKQRCLFLFCGLLCTSLFTSLGTTIQAADPPHVTQCFKVNALVRMDPEHYWANWTNTCPYTVDSVYVKVEFADASQNRVGNGLWSMHFVTPGKHQVTRLSTPANVVDYRSVTVRKITTSLDEALQ